VRMTLPCRPLLTTGRRWRAGTRPCCSSSCCRPAPPTSPDTAPWSGHNRGTGQRQGGADDWGRRGRSGPSGGGTSRSGCAHTQATCSQRRRRITKCVTNTKHYQQVFCCQCRVARSLTGPPDTTRPASTPQRPVAHTARAPRPHTSRRSVVISWSCTAIRGRTASCTRRYLVEAQIARTRSRVSSHLRTRR
jgi:hypothetical protein